MRTTRFIRDRSIDTPPSTALTWPSSDEPAPNGTIGAPKRAVVGRLGQDDDVGLARRVPGFAVTVLLDDRGVRAATIAEQSPELGDQGRTSVRGQTRGRAHR
jgi:hypothetical protein